MGSVEAVTTGKRQKRLQAIAALMSMSSRTRPPNKVPRGLVWLGKTVSTVVIQSDETGVDEVESVII